MEILGVISANQCMMHFSTNAKFKNAKSFNDQSLIYWTIKPSKKLKLDKITVSTDHKRIK